MVAVIKFFIKIVALILVFVQATASDTGAILVASSLSEPVFLSICGVLLLVVGVAGRRSVDVV